MGIETIDEDAYCIYKSKFVTRYMGIETKSHILLNLLI